MNHLLPAKAVLSLSRYLILILLLPILISSCTKSNPGSPRVNHVSLNVSDMEKSINFYTQAFGLHVTDRIASIERTLDDGSVINSDVNIVFLKFPDQPGFVYELAETNKLDTLERLPRFIHIGIDVKNIEEAFASATKHGAGVLAPIRTVRANGIEAKQAFLAGPDNEVVELMQMIQGVF